MIIVNLIKAKEVLEPLLQQKVSPKLSYKIMKFVSKIEVEETFYNSKLKEIINKYGLKDSNDEFVTSDGGIKIIDGLQEECKSALIELDSTEVENPNIKFTLDELSEIKLSAIDMFALDAFIDEQCIK